MCVAFPAKITGIEGNLAEVELFGAVRQVFLALEEGSVVRSGDWLLISGNLALGKLSEAEAKESLMLLSSLSPKSKLILQDDAEEEDDKNVLQTSKTSSPWI